ncbi:SecDF P1 head subdomain-containing protein [Isoptericola jiangsuensis]|uniref:SecDF P1 head subdomain-containing protein n=1 Tax=Isoptericola jiangsuensis TaxID=548579 RepID=UPI00386B9F3B
MRLVDPQQQGTYHYQGRQLALKEPPLVTSADIIDVRIVKDTAGQPAVMFRMREETKDRLLAATEAAVGQQMAVTVDQRVLTVATVYGPFAEDMQIAGMVMTADEVQAMVRHITDGGPQPLR